MKIILVALAFFLFSIASVAAADSSSHVRILLHDHKEMKKGWGAAGWMVLPDFISATKVMVVFGPRYSQPARSDSARAGKRDSLGKLIWWLEVMGGTFVSKEEVSKRTDKIPLIDIRFSPPTLGKHLTHWLNIEWIDLTKGRQGKFYWYYQFDLALPGGLGKIGLESENVHKRGKDSLSLGPHLIVPVGNHLKITTAYQFRRRHEGNQWWFRTSFDL